MANTSEVNSRLNIDALPANEKLDRETVRTLIAMYRENSRVAEVFWEWRFKVLERYFAAAAGALVAAGWAYKEPNLRPYLFLLLLLGSVFCVVSAILDYKNQLILKNCYEVGVLLESRLTPTPGIYGRLDRDYRRVRYGKILLFLYSGSSLVLLALSLYAFYQFR